MKMWKHVTVSGMVAVAFLLSLGSPVNAAENVVYSQGFESDTGGFVTAYGSAGWVWGTPPSLGWGPGGAHSGTKCWGTFANDQKLPRGADGSIVSPAISLPAISGNQIIRVRFWAYISIDGMYDRGQFFVSKDGVDWESKIQLYNNMETSPSVVPSWKKYEIGLDPSYAGGNVYLRFRAATPYSVNFYCGGGDDLSGLFIDDLAITVYDTTGDRKIFTMNAYEDQSTWASCPWVAPWNGTTFVADNDIYSVARGEANEYVDFYRLMQPLVAVGGMYPVQLQERETEVSFTDYLGLMEIDHSPDVAVAPDQDGGLHGYVPGALLAPETAVDNSGNDVLAHVALADGVVYPAYSGDTVTADFGTADVSQGAVLVLRVQGFVVGEGNPSPYIGPPAVVVQTLDANGQWQERGRLLPRYEFSVAAFDLAPFLSTSRPVMVRLLSISHDIKYHAIDAVSLYAGSPPAFEANLVPPIEAAFGAANILDTLKAPDGEYQKMTPGDACTLQFPALGLTEGKTRDFVFVSKGYYVPQGGSFLVYTWDGTSWVERDATSYPGSWADMSFDLSLFLPDPNGEYRVRVWQDYQYEPAGIDFVEMGIGANLGTLTEAWDYRYSSSILSQVASRGGTYDSWSYCPRNRVTEYLFTPPTPSNIPPTTDPVLMDPATRTISWTYSDTEGDPQAEAQVQIWTGPGATGSIKWNPPLLSGTGTSVAYPAGLLSPGTYYARVQANDGVAGWGAWSEAQSVVPALPPTAAAIRVFNSRNTGGPYYYQLTASDPADAPSALKLYVIDSADPLLGVVAGPFSSGNVVQIIKGAAPGSVPGTGLVKAKITVVGGAEIYAVNSAGTLSALVLLPAP